MASLVEELRALDSLAVECGILSAHEQTTMLTVALMVRAGAPASQAARVCGISDYRARAFCKSFIRRAAQSAARYQRGESYINGSWVDVPKVLGTLDAATALESPIEVLRLGPEYTRRLRNSGGISTVSDLVTKSEADLAGIKGIGKKAMIRIKRLLGRSGLRLGMHHYIDAGPIRC